MLINTSKLDDWDNIFKSKLKFICESTRKIVLIKKLGEEEIFQLKTLADDFFEDFRKSPIPVRRSNLDYSTAIMLPFGHMLIPFFFVEVFQEEINFSFDEEFSQEIKWSELVGILFQKWNSKRKKLTRTMVLICKVLSRYGIEGQSYRFPITPEIIANRTRQSLSIIKISYLTPLTNSIIEDFFLINPWKLGWEIYLLSYPLTKKENFNDFEDETIAVELCSGNKVFQVIQKPMKDNTEALALLKSKISDVGGKMYLIHSTVFNWDLSQLNPRSEKSFQMPPYFLNNSPSVIEPTIQFKSETQNFSWFTGNPSDEKKKRNKFSPNAKRGRIMNVLNYLIENGIPMVNYESVAEKVGLSVHEFNEILQYLIENKVIVLAYRFKFIGAGREYSFIIENSNPTLNNLIKQNLLQCVFSYFYESESMIAGRLQVPDKWVANLLQFFNRLQMRKLELEISYGQRLHGYSLFIPNIKLPKNYILNDFGMYS